MIALGWGICIVIAIALHEFVEKNLTRLLKYKPTNKTRADGKEI